MSSTLPNFLTFILLALFAAKSLCDLSANLLSLFPTKKKKKKKDMAEALVGGAFLSASLQVMFDRLATREFINFFSKQKMDDGLLAKLKITLLALQAVLDDAEDKQINNKRVKDWLDELQHVIYQADDLLDEIATKALRDKLEADHVQSQTQSSTTQVGFRQFLLPIKQSLLGIDPSVSTSAYLSDEVMGSRMKEVIRKLESFVEQKGCLNLRENVGRKQWNKLQTTSLVDESEVYGRDKDKKKVIQLLLSGNATENEIPVIPIVGMGGVDEFDVSVITEKIIEAVTTSTNVKKDQNDLDQLQIKLKESLAGKKFLIVLDDVWNDDYIAWDLLKKPFIPGAQESRIIITTRMDKVASVMSTIPSYCNLKELSSEDCWSLFAKHAFVNGDYSSHPELERIGRKIVEKCKGLPLAVKSLGGILRSKIDIDEWKYVLNSELWALKESNILPALILSYHYLPSQLKRYFAYCSIFHKDYKFKKEKLVKFWIAENLVQHENNMLLEDVGNHYFHELLSRSFFQRLSDTYFVMLDKGKAHNISKKVRHLSYVQGYFDQFKKFKAVNKVEYLRSR
ncbi:putative disease resistance RPP13-like protein 1 isoform X2 [Cornus florida]|uniref:putative disease resistance RPP13-like protein 1 isoform X2 n=1 Tax=Cornus florida TaxID=4283 RepID=UPI00289DED21|nr:putative disease resistance RPP13-like protein 1 isoform X2 [Cornus florida]